MLLDNVSSSKYILDTSREYSLYVCEQRAIPQLSDGLKSSQRKMLWVIKNKREKIKTISLAGEAISEGLYVHGDQSASQVISLLAAPYVNNVPLLTGLGAFGSLADPYSFGAPRYTYVKKNKFTEKVLYADLDIIPLIENYDGSNLEPKHFLPLLPLVLLNGVSGIAIGWSTEILPRNFIKLIETVVDVINNKKIEEIPPEYSYLDVETIKIENNVWEFRGKIEKKDNQTIIIKSLPPELTLEKIKERLDSFEEEGKIQNYIDNSSEKIEIIVKFKRNFIADWSNEKIIEFLKLRTKKTERIIVIDFDGNTIKNYDSSIKLIKDWVDWRKKFYYKRFEKMLNDSKNEIEYYNGIKICFEQKLLEKMPNCKNKKEVFEIVKKTIGEISEKNLEKIVNLPIYKWNREYYEEILENIKKLSEKILEYISILNSDEKICQIFSEEVLNLKKLMINNNE